MHPVSQKVVARTPAALKRPVAVIVRTVDGAIADRLPGLAAEIAFWVTLSLPALAVAAIAAISLVSDIEGLRWQEQIVDRTVEVARVALTPDTIDSVVEPVLRDLLDSSNAGLVSFAFLTAVWTASRAVRVVLVTATLVYGRKGVRAPWKDRFLGLGITLGGLVVGAVLAPLLLAGPNFGDRVEEWTQAQLDPLPGLWSALYWPSVVLLGTLALSLLYHLAIPGRTPWRYDMPGAVLATAVWLAGSGALRLYGAYIQSSTSSYGPLAGPIVVLLWLWLTGFAVLLGAELNAHTAAESRAVPEVRDPHGEDHDTEGSRSEPEPVGHGGDPEPGSSPATR